MPDFVTIAALEKVLVTLLENATGLPIVIEDHAGPRPSGPFGSIDTMTGTPENFEIGEFDADTEAETLRGETYISGRIAFYGKGAFDNVRRVINVLNSSARQFDLLQVMGFSGFEIAQDTSVDFRGKREERADVRFSGYAALGETFPADFFTSSQWGLKVPNVPHEDDVILPKER